MQETAFLFQFVHLFVLRSCAMAAPLAAPMASALFSTRRDTQQRQPVRVVTEGIAHLAVAMILQSFCRGGEGCAKFPAVCSHRHCCSMCSVGSHTERCGLDWHRFLSQAAPRSGASLTGAPRGLFYSFFVCKVLTKRLHQRQLQGIWRPTSSANNHLLQQRGCRSRLSRSLGEPVPCGIIGPRQQQRFVFWS